MKASVFHSRGNIRCEDVADPVITSPDQMIVAIEATSICGSDLYLFDGPFDQLVPGGHVTGHEILGRVIDVGSEVTRFRKGDRITTPFSLACHHCAMCELGMTGHCETTQAACYGYGPAAGNLGGSHAEAAIVHLADVNARIVPDAIHVADAITLSCNLPTAILGVETSGLQPGETIALVGCGPTALMTLDIILEALPARVVVLDRVPHRLAVAAAKGVVTINIDDADWLERARAEAGKSGFDRVIEVVGSNESIAAALSLIRPGGTIVGLGCFAVPEIRMNPFIASLRNINIRMEGTANVAVATERALQMLLDGEVSPRDYFTHEYTLSDIDQAWTAFSAKDSGIIKTLIRPLTSLRKTKKEQHLVGSDNSKQRSVELGRAFVVALNDWDFVGLERMLTPDASLEMPYAPEPIPKLLSGRDAMISFFRTLPAVWDTANFHDIEVATVGDDASRLVATYRADTIVKTTGLRYRNSYVSFFSLDGDRISRVTEHYDPVQAIGATGGKVPPVAL